MNARTRLPALLLLASGCATAGEPPWEPVPSVEIPGYSGGGMAVPAGSHLRVIAVEGDQICDFFAFAREDPREHLDTRRTLSAIDGSSPSVGDIFFSNKWRPMLTLMDDTSQGVHDVLVPPCDPVLYEFIGAGADHPSCAENFHLAASALGLPADYEPGPVNFFQNSPLLKDGNMEFLPAGSGPGDYVEVRAEMDLYVVATACSWDIPPYVSGETSTPIRLEVVTPDADDER